MVGLATVNGFLVTSPVRVEHVSTKQEGVDVAVSLLSTVKDSTLESSLLAALSSMESFFISGFITGKLRSRPVARQSCGIEYVLKMDGVQEGHWVGTAYSVYINLLLELMTKEGVSPTFQVKVVRTLMEFVRVETPGTFSNDLYAKLINAVVTANLSITNIMAVLESEYFQYADIRYFTALNVRRFADERASLKHEDRPVSDKLYVRNLYEVLLHLPLTPKGDKGNENTDYNKTWCCALSTKTNMANGAESNAAEKWKDASVQRGAFLKSWKSFIKLSQPPTLHKKSYGDMLSRVLSSTSRSCANAAPDSFLTSLADEVVDERLMRLAACKDTTTDDLFPVKGFRCGRSIEVADWMVSAARGKEDDDDDDHDDDEDEDEDDDDDDDAKDAGGEDDDIEGEEGEEEGEDEEDDEGEADDNGEDDDGEEEDGEDDDGDEDAEGEEEEEDDEDGDHDEDDDDDDAEGESEEDVEPPKKKRK